MRAVFAGVGAVGVVLGIAWMAQAGADRPGQIFDYENAETVAAGAALYGDYCASCHGENLEGQENWQVRGADGLLPAPPHDPTGHTWHHPDGQLLEIVRIGTAALVGGGYRSSMIGFGDQLSDAEIASIMAFIKSTWPDEVIDIHNQINAERAVN